MADFFLPLFLALFTFIFRVYNLLAVPIFTDEAIYIRWAQIGFADPAHRFIALTDGKQPLLTWLMYPFLFLFDDPLFAGRFVSVLSGVFAVLGIYFLSKSLFGRKTALFASLLYLFSPFPGVYDRLALMDSLLASFAVWSLYLQTVVVRKIRLDAALLSGMSMGLGYLTKTSAQFFMLLVPFSLLLFDFRTKNITLRLLKWIFFSLISIILTLAIYNMLRLSPWFYIINLKNHTFVMTFAEFFRSPFRVLLPNLNGMVPMLATYLTLPVFLASLAGILIGLYRKERKILLLALWFLAPFAGLAFFGIVIFPRFMLFMAMPLLLIAAYGVRTATQGVKSTGRLFPLVAFSIIIYPAVQTVILMVSPQNAIIPRSDRNQLFDDWPSGYGVREVIEYIKPFAEKGKVTIATEGTFGLNPAVYEIYFGRNPNVEILGFWPVSSVPVDLVKKAEDHPVFFIFKETGKVPESWPLELVFRFRRGRGETELLFYRVLSERGL